MATSVLSLVFDPIIQQIELDVVPLLVSIAFAAVVMISPVAAIWFYRRVYRWFGGVPDVPDVFNNSGGVLSLGGRWHHFKRFDDVNQADDDDSISVIINGRYRKFKSNKTDSFYWGEDVTPVVDVQKPRLDDFNDFDVPSKQDGSLNTGDYRSRDVSTEDDIWADKFHNSRFFWWAATESSGLNTGDYRLRDKSTEDDLLAAMFDVGETFGGDLNTGDYRSRDVSSRWDLYDTPHTEDEYAQILHILFPDSGNEVF